MAAAWVSVHVDGNDMRVYMSQSEATDQVHRVVVIMEAFGVNKHIQDITARLAGEGDVAVAPILYHRLGSNPLFSYAGEDAWVRRHG